MPRIFAALLLIASSIASAQVQFAPTAGGTYVALDGKTVKDGISVRLAGCPAGPWQFAVDGVAANTENTCPFALVGDDALYDTKALTNGAHTITAKGPTSTLTASFTVANTGSTAWRGTMTLKWIPPTTNTDNTPLTPLAGYRIKYGTMALSLGEVVEVNNPGLTQFAINNLPAGTYYFAMTAAATSGIESAETPVVSKALVEPTTPPPTCPAQPAPESRQQACAAPTVGNWTQSRTYSSVAAPTCWEAAAWTPVSAPAGVCAAPAPLVTAGPLSYFTAGTASAPAMTAVGYVAAGLPCGPDTKTVGGMKFCRITKPQTDLIGFPVPLAGTDLWSRASP